MRPVVNDDIRVQGSLGGETVKFTLDENSLQHLMTQFIDLYSNPTLAVVREYSTNAWDSHVEAGIDKPIEVTLPSGLNPYLRIKDYGVGMSADDIRNIYSKYGASTKRNTDDQTGMLGLGCKSALTYTNQFTMVCVKQGRLVNAAIRREADGGAVVEFVGGEQATDLPNGVEIIIPAKDHREMSQVANDFFRCWKPGTVLVNGQTPAGYDGKPVGKRMLIIQGHNDIVVMGNVPYPVGNKISGNVNLGWNKRVVAWVAIGDVQPTPNREGLIYKGKTNQMLDALRDELLRELRSSAEQDVNKAKTHFEALQAALSWYPPFATNSFSYKGRTVKSVFEIDGWEFRINAHRYAVRRDPLIEITKNTDLRDYVFVQNFELDGVNTYLRSKVRNWLRHNGLSPSKVIFAKQALDIPWLDGFKCVNWSEIKEFKMPRQKRGTTSGKYSLWDRKNKVWNLTSVDEIEDNVYYYSSAEGYNARSLETIFPDHAIVELPKNRWDKFKRAFPKAAHVSDGLSVIKDEIAKQLDYIDKVRYTYDYWALRNYSSLSAKEIEDPELRAFVEATQAANESPALQRARKFTSSSGVKLDIEKPANPMDKYPMAQYVPLHHPEGRKHLYDYINTTYRSNNAG